MHLRHLENEISPTATLDRTDRTAPPNPGGREMPAYRAPRPGDLLAVRTTSPHDGEQHIVLDLVADNGNVLVMSGVWDDCDLQIIVRRVGDTDPIN